MSVLNGKNVVLGVGGGISAYKAAELCRLLRKANATVHVVMTGAACRFIAPLTMQTLSGHPVARDLFDGTEESEIGHIRLADEADVVVLVPATANLIARLAAGMASDLLSAVVLATKAPVLLAPAMNVNMWENPLTQANLARLLANPRITTVGPDSGELACGWVGAGRLVDPPEILRAIEARADGGKANQSLGGRKIVVTAGPTFEPIDDVRFVGNRSSGKMGFAMAAAAARLGGDVTLIAGPVSLPTPVGISRRIDVQTARDMQSALTTAAASADVVVMAAAVADFRPETKIAGKLSRRVPGKSSGATVALTLQPNPDLLAGLGERRRGKKPFLVGFAAEVAASNGGLAKRARAKLVEKRCDVVIANDVSAPGLGFGSDRNAVTMVFPKHAPVELPPASKDVLADSIWINLLKDFRG